MRLIEAFPCGDALFDHCVRLNFEGIVAKRVDKPYTSGPARWWLKLKNPRWVHANQQRYLMFDGHKKPEPREDDWQLEPGQRPGIVRELKKHQVLLEHQIAELNARLRRGQAYD